MSRRGEEEERDGGEEWRQRRGDDEGGMGENKRKIREKSADNKYTVILRGTSRIEFRTGTSDKPRILGTRNNKVEGNTDSEAGLVGKNSSNEAHRMFLPF